MVGHARFDAGAGDGQRGPDQSRGVLAYPGTCQFSLPALPQNLRAARWLLRDWLVSARWPAGQVENVVLAVNEAVSNAIEHAHPATAAAPDPLPTVDVHAVLRAGPSPPGAPGPPSEDAHGTWRRAWIEITDHGRWQPRDVDHSPVDHSPEALGHLHRDRRRGLVLMRALMDHVLIDRGTDNGGGTRVTLITNTTAHDPA